MATVIDHAIQLLSEYWRISYDGFQVAVHNVPCLDPGQSENKYTDYPQVERFVKASAPAVHQDPQFGSLLEDVSLLLQHCVRRTYQIEFTRCQSEGCLLRCTEITRESKLLSVHVVRGFQGKMPTPQAHPQFPGHFKTYLEMKTGQLLKERY